MHCSISPANPQPSFYIFLIPIFSNSTRASGPAATGYIKVLPFHFHPLIWMVGGVSGLYLSFFCLFVEGRRFRETKGRKRIKGKNKQLSTGDVLNSCLAVFAIPSRRQSFYQFRRCNLPSPWLLPPHMLNHKRNKNAEGINNGPPAPLQFLLFLHFVSNVSCKWRLGLSRPAAGTREYPV